MQKNIAPRGRILLQAAWMHRPRSQLGYMILIIGALRRQGGCIARSRGARPRSGRDRSPPCRHSLNAEYPRIFFSSGAPPAASPAAAWGAGIGFTTFSSLGGRKGRACLLIKPGATACSQCIAYGREPGSEETPVRCAVTNQMATDLTAQRAQGRLVHHSLHGAGGSRGTNAHATPQAHHAGHRFAA